MNSCKALIKEGPRKGEPCIPTTSIDSDGYCMRHQRQKEYDTFISQGKMMCRMFFRGCNSEIAETEKTCSICLGKNKKNPCSHRNSEGVQCTFEILHDKTKYCGKHQRDDYKDYEKDNNVRICNIERGCMNMCEPEFQSCTSCIINDYIVNDRYFSEDIDCDLCIVCDKSYDRIDSSLNTILKRCNACFNEFMNNHKSKKVLQKRIHRDMPIKSYYNSYIKGACSRKQEIIFDLTLDEFSTLIKQSCFYCTMVNENDFMGIDRVDNRKGYTMENCVPCCTTCNRMKYSYTIEEFVNKCIAIYKYQTEGISISNKLSESFSSFKTLSTKFYGDYKRDSSNKTGRNLDFALEKDEFNVMRTKPCYLCGIKNTDSQYNGIDRLDNSKGYISSNCKPCCGHCNYIKGPIPIGILKYHVLKISQNPNLQKYIITIPETTPDISVSTDDIYGEIQTGRFISKKLAELFTKSLDDVLNYCKVHNRSNTFIRKVQNLYATKSEKSKDEIHISLVRFINAEVEKAHVENRSEKKHMKTNDVLTYLEENRLDEYLEWHTTNIGPETSLFRKSLEEFIKVLPRLSASEKSIQCKELLKKEHNRRNYFRTSEKLKERKETLKNTFPTRTPISIDSPNPTKSPESPKFAKPFNVVKLSPTKPKIIEHMDDVHIPKQWKSHDIYNFIKNNNAIL